jgi:hypothetical protein
MLRALVFGVVLGDYAIYVGLDGIHQGELVHSLPGRLALPGEWVVAMGIFILGVTLWGFWKWVRVE